MSIKFAIDRTKNLTVFRLYGEVTLSEFIDTLNVYGKNKPTKFELYDLRELSGERFATNEIQGLASFLAAHAEKRVSGSKTAVVVSQTIDYGLSRMISMLTEGQVPYMIEVFRSVQDANQWLEEP
jgi:hypothetical protein